jgi:hypothetical protein
MDRKTYSPTINAHLVLLFLGAIATSSYAAGKKHQKCQDKMAL